MVFIIDIYIMDNDILFWFRGIEVLYKYFFIMVIVLLLIIIIREEMVSILFSVNRYVFIKFR